MNYIPNIYKDYELIVNKIKSSIDNPQGQKISDIILNYEIEVVRNGELIDNSQGQKISDIILNYEIEVVRGIDFVKDIELYIIERAIERIKLPNYNSAFPFTYIKVR